MARFSRNKRSSRPSVSPWMTAFYIGAILFAPMLFMGMIPSASAQDTEKPLTDSNAITGPVIGIDLGTTYSCVGIMKNGKVEILANDQGNRITPSWVAWNDDERLVGDAAKNQFASNPHRTVYDIKRLIGRKITDRDTQKDIKHFPFKVVTRMVSHASRSR